MFNAKILFTNSVSSYELHIKTTMMITKISLIFVAFAFLTLSVEGKAIQGSAKEWPLGCVKRSPAARGSQDTGITQPRDHSLTDPCNHVHRKIGNNT